MCDMDELHSDILRPSAGFQTVGARPMWRTPDLHYNRIDATSLRTAPPIGNQLPVAVFPLRVPSPRPFPNLSEPLPLPVARPQHAGDKQDKLRACTILRDIRLPIWS